MTRDDLYELLKSKGIHPRRYFHPLISHFEPYSRHPSAHPSGLVEAERAAREILCLPIYPDLDDADVARVATHIRERR